ncbi:hypothetical protein HYN56_18400 [Flavobacterium crocinum]|uniref:Uncharacterized protein n=1 Tax=Flavobacterium crocinum TaxID=2183896 RepID=A0A2S1YPQ7_9FLAO|nr:hypothetical protein [Flavobacterium crocinum]AWK06090.1 hypothetical protein HYN56_18400 [Flavobacterium crocinum]
MTYKLSFILFLCFCFYVNSQNNDNSNVIEDRSISAQLFVKYFRNLNQGAEIFEKYPALKSGKVKFCSLLECMYLNAYKEEDIKFAAKQRLIGIATQLYNEGTPVYLIMGLDSYLTAKERNLNLEDDNHIVYINYGECTNPSYLREAAEIVNRQTHSLINKTVSK